MVLLEQCPVLLLQLVRLLRDVLYLRFLLLHLELLRRDLLLKLLPGALLRLDMLCQILNLRIAVLELLRARLYVLILLLGGPLCRILFLRGTRSV